MKGKKKTNYVSRHAKKEKKVKVKYGRIFLALIILLLIIYSIFTYIKIPIKNIFISGNSSIKDQEIIDIAGISNYPSILSFTSYGIEQKLEKNILIKDAIVKKQFRTITIEIEENYPLFYNQNIKKTVMYDFRETSDDMNAPILIN